MQILELPRDVLARRMVLPRRPTVSPRAVSDRLLTCFVLSGRIGGYAPAHRDGRTRWAGDEASAFAKEDRFFALNPTAECVDSSIGVHPLQNMVANNRPKIEFFSEAQKNARRDL